MQRVQGYKGIQEIVAGQDDQARVKVRLRLGPDPVETINLELALIETHAVIADLLVSVIEDPESTPQAHGVLVLLNGTAGQMQEFAAEMVLARAARAR